MTGLVFEGDGTAARFLYIYEIDFRRRVCCKLVEERIMGWEDVIL